MSEIKHDTVYTAQIFFEWVFVIVWISYTRIMNEIPSADYKPQLLAEAAHSVPWARRRRPVPPCYWRCTGRSPPSAWSCTSSCPRAGPVDADHGAESGTWTRHCPSSRCRSIQNSWWECIWPGKSEDMCSRGLYPGHRYWDFPPTLSSFLQHF